MTLALGLMSGTSADGVDAVTCDIRISRQTPHIGIVASAFIPYPENLKKRLLKISSSGGSAKEICELNVAIGAFFAKAALKAIKNRKIKIIGSHGQTIFHSPQTGSTMQIGDSTLIAKKTGVPVWSDFRLADMANGGEGAPLAPVIHLPLFGDRRKNVCVVNIGGIANITYIPAGSRSLADLKAYDTGPGNMLIDTAIRKMKIGEYDMEGRLAASGLVDDRLLTKFLKHPYFKKRAPKSTGREMFGEAFIKWAGIGAKTKWNKNLVATITELTARTIADEIKKLKRADRLIVCGGGAKNRYLLGRIRALVSAEVVTSDSLGVPSQSVEGALMALLGFYADRGIGLDLRSITGSKGKNVLLGKLTPV